MPKQKLPNKKFQWTPELAYVIGLMVTDGNLSKDGRHMTMRSSDIQLLKIFKRILKLKAKIIQTKNDGWSKKPCYRIQFGNVQFYKWLMTIGLTPAKTYTIERIAIPNNYFCDFLRGHLDGDGSIWTYKDYYNTFKNPKYVYIRLYTAFLSASEVHIKWIQSKITNLLNIKGDISNRKPQRKYQKATMWRLRFSKKESLKLLPWLYYNQKVPCLTRKRKVAKKFISEANKPLCSTNKCLIF